MAVRRTKKSTVADIETPLLTEASETLRGVKEATITKLAPTTAEDFVRVLNTAVTNVHAVFQLRDQLHTELDALKAQLGLGRAMLLDHDRLRTMKQEQEIFDYEFGVKKERREKELDQMEEERRERWEAVEEEQKEKLKTVADAQALKLRLEREEHERRLQLEGEDGARLRGQLERERQDFVVQQQAFDAERTRLRETLVNELNKENVHAQEVATLQYQRELELLKGELKLEQANRQKFETLLQEAKSQNDRLTDLLSQLSREALASASSAAMAAKLKELVSESRSGASTSATRS